MGAGKMSWHISLGILAFAPDTELEVERRLRLHSFIYFGELAVISMEIFHAKGEGGEVSGEGTHS